MTLVPFAPPPGLNSDDTAFAAEGRWADGNNVRFWQGKPQVIGGSLDTGFNALVAISAILPYTYNGSTYTAYAGDNKLFVGLTLTTPTDRTPAGGPSGIPWHLAPYGSSLLACPSGGTLYQLTDPTAAAGVKATVIANAPDNITCILTPPERQVLALGCNEEVSGTFNSLCIRGSDLEDPTDWTTTATNNAFEHVLEDGGRIITGKLISSYVAVWTTTSLYLGEFIGNPGQAYRFDRVDKISGPISQTAVTVLNSVAYWLGADRQLYRWTPGTIPEAIPCPISRDLFNNFDGTAAIRTIVAPNVKYSEIWVLYPDARDTNNAHNSRYVAVSILDGSWFKGLLARCAVVDHPLIGQLAVNSNSTSIVMADRTGVIYVHERGATGPNGWHIQSADQYIDSSKRRMMIRGVIPDFEYQASSSGASSDVSLTLFVRDRPQSTAVTKGPYTLTTATTKNDFRASGKLIAVKFSSPSQGPYMRLGKPLFDMVLMGDR